jgi:CDP-4-dehydro-6-deoxyglucose reductase, E1
MNVRIVDSSASELRAQILALTQDYFAAKGQPAFIPGKTYIPCSGKMLDAADLRNMVDASLDMWLTAGRFCEDFERQLANRLALRMP